MCARFGSFLLLLALAAGSAQAVSISPAVQVGTVGTSSLAEISGVVGSRSLSGTLWVHNDSGDSAQFYAISTAGALLGTFPLAGASATDWEDIAIGPAPVGNYLYLGDIGDNDGVRSTIAVYRVTEPTIATGATIAAGDYKKATLQYPGGAKLNAESLLVDPWTGDTFIVTKDPSGQVYKFSQSAYGSGGTTTLTSLGTLGIPINRPSAADISPDGRHILVRDRSTIAYLFERGPTQSVWDALQGPAINVTLHSEVQGEAIGWAANGAGFYTTSERSTGGPQPIYFYAFVPEPASGQLIGCGLVLLAAALVGRRFARVGQAPRA